MRSDSLGLFWEEIDDKMARQIKVLGEKGWEEILPGYWCQSIYINDEDVDEFQCALKMDLAYAVAKNTTERCEPPEPTWLSPDYLPGLEESRRFPVTLYTDNELIADANQWQLGRNKKHRLVFDIECYANYFLIAFQSVEHRKVTYLEMTLDIPLWREKMQWIFDNFTLIGFNSIGYDMVIAALALAGQTNAQLKTATNQIIVYQEKPYQILRARKAKKIVCDHIDLIEVAPLFASLKIYGGRLHAGKMQDLPFDPEVVLSDDQITIVRYYCINDLDNTLVVLNNLTKELDLREKMTQQYGTDLRSKSDAQIAEAVISAEVGKMNRTRLQRPRIDPGTTYYYKMPEFIKYESDLMKWVYEKVRTSPFVVNEKGSIGLPPVLKDLKINIANSTYKMGIGGLHSTEKKVCHRGGINNTLEDVDVESYYPKIILNQQLYPQHLGPNFLITYESLVNRRLIAKANGDDSTSGSLKIVINGSFGKLGSKWSVLYAPDLLIQVTITGQLALLMLIERLELVGIPVVSANTDGIVINCPNKLMPLRNEILKQWQADTDFKLDGNVYSALYSRDVNNYIAVKKNPKKPSDQFKVKGAYARPGFHKNPTNEICIMALEAYLAEGVPVKQTIEACTDITKFISVRTVKGGAYKEGEFLGKAVRWYYGTQTPGPIIYALNGKRVPRSEGATPMLQMPTTLPTDIDYTWYTEETKKILDQIGF